MSSKPLVVLGLTLTIMGGSALQAEAGFVGWGKTNYETPTPPPVRSFETPAPTPEPLALHAAVEKVKPGKGHGSHERAANVRRRDAVQKLAKDVPPAPTPDRVAGTESGSGPIESAAPTIRDLVTKHARENGIPDKLAAAVVSIESRFNPKARGGSALGLMQIKYDTARSMGYAGGVTALMAPETNLRFGMKVLADAYKASNGDVCMTLARYQSGHRVARASAANRSYCARARAYMARAS